jgi:hypothetical protein
LRHHCGTAICGRRAVPLRRVDGLADGILRTEVACAAPTARAVIAIPTGERCIRTGSLFRRRRHRTGCGQRRCRAIRVGHLPGANAPADSDRAALRPRIIAVAALRWIARDIGRLARRAADRRGGGARPSARAASPGTVATRARATRSSFAGSSAPAARAASSGHSAARHDEAQQSERELRADHSAQ